MKIHFFCDRNNISHIKFRHQTAIEVFAIWVVFIGKLFFLFILLFTKRKNEKNQCNIIFMLKKIKEFFFLLDASLKLCTFAKIQMLIRKIPKKTWCLRNR